MIRSLSGRYPSSNSRAVRPSVKRLEFDTRVWLEKPPGSGDWREIYCFTAMQSESGAAPIILEDLRDWQSLYPDLAEVHQKHGKIDGEVVHVQANFKLEEMPAKSHLGIQVFVDLAHTQGYTTWRYSSRFYSSVGKAVYTCANDLKPSPIHGSSKVRLEIPLESKWWVNVLWRFSRQRSAAIAQGTLESLQQEERRIRRELQGMSISQEIFATDVFGCERRLTTLLWRFDQTVGEEAATTVWRKVVQHQFRHATSTPKVEEYDNFPVNAVLPMETTAADSGGTAVLLPSTEDVQSQLGRELEWFGQSNSVVQCTEDDVFNITHTRQLLHSQEKQFTDNTNDTTEVSTSQSLENIIWEPTSCGYALPYDKPPYDYQADLVFDEGALDHPGTGHSTDQHHTYESQTANHQMEDFTGGEICLQYGLDDPQPDLESRVGNHSCHGDSTLQGFGPENPHGVLNTMMESQQQPDELILDPAFSDPNHAINHLYHYPALDDHNIELERPALPAGGPEHQSPEQPDQYQLQPVEHSQILASQPEANDQISEGSASQPQSVGDELTIPSQHDQTPQSQQTVESLHFEDDWDPNLVPHLFDGTDFHTAALEILGTEIVLPDAEDCHALEYHLHGDSQQDEQARVLGEIGVDIGVDEAKDWVLVKSLDSHA